MTDEEFDIDTPDEAEQGVPPKPSLREVWETNPMMKLAAIVLGLAISVGAYVAFAGKGDEGANKTILQVGDTAQIKQVPGQKELDPVYRKALEESNLKTAEIAAQSGGSALPTPIGTPKTGMLNMPDIAGKPKTDPLAEWRRATETRRLSAEKPEPAEDEPDAVPMVQPIRPQPAMNKQQNSDLAKRLAEQMRVIVGAQAPLKSQVLGITNEDSLYTVQKRQEEELKTEMRAAALTQESAQATGPDGEKVKTRTIVPAGSIAYAQLLNALNSDIQGPVLAQILSGPFEGGRAVGKIEVKDEYMVLSFNRIVKDAVSYSVEGIAMDEASTLAGMATDVDHHYFMRVVLPAAAKFVEGYGASVAATGTTITQTSGGGQAAEAPEPDARENVYKGLEESTKTVSDMLAKQADRPITVKIAKGTTMGILFTDTVTTKDAEK